MKIFKTEEYFQMENPNPGQAYWPEILTKEHGAKNLGGMFGLLVPGSLVPDHLLDFNLIFHKYSVLSFGSVLSAIIP